MSGKNKTLHLICNAHIDPAWLWEWQEGATEALSTFRTAAELCESEELFVFNHNEVILYKWVQRYEPELFKRIQKLVKAGRWHIMGGWYLQPDCNMPSGESFVRQILLGRAYFKKYFNVTPTTAINFDPFGHTRGLVQILAKSGYDSYLFGRPEPRNCPLPSDNFIWVGYDGSEIFAHRFEFPYISRAGKAREKIEKWLESNNDKKLGMVLWGVGNHGGGPSKIDLRNVNKLIARTKDYNICHSTPEAYFKQLKRLRNELPRHSKDINPWAVGCYTSHIRIKQKHRQLENEIYSLEKMASAAAVQGLMRYPYEQIHEALCDLMTSQFHDILPGSSIEAVEEASLRMLDHGFEIAAREKTRAFFALASGQPKAQKGKIPVLVYNPHPFRVKTLLECEFNLADISDKFTDVKVFHKNRLIPSQVEQEASNLPVDWRKRVAFVAELEPSQMNRFDCQGEVTGKKPVSALRAKKGRIVFKTKDLEVVVNTRTGFVDRYKVRGRDCVGKKAFEPIVIRDIEDSWAKEEKKFRDVAGRFKLMDRQQGSKFSGLPLDGPGMKLDSVRVIEDGPARSIIEVVLAYGQSSICQHYKLPKFGTEIEVQTRVYWNEKTRMLKLSVPTIGDDNKYIGQVAYGVGELPCNGDEAVAQKWVAVTSQKRNFALTCINDSIYGSDFSKDTLRLTLLRSAAYAADQWPNIPQDRFLPRMEQGQRLFRFWFNGGRVRERLERIDREALVKNEKPFVVPFFPSGKGKKPNRLAVLSDDVIQITAIKRAQSNNDLIIRLFEPTGKSRTTVLSLPFMNRKIPVALGGFEIRTLRVKLGTGKVMNTNLLERPM